MNENPDQTALPGMPTEEELAAHVPNLAKVFVRQVTEENIPLIAKESGKTETELTAMLMARREMHGPEARLRVRYLVVGEHHAHKPVKHKDGKQRWCDECGLTGDGLVPQEKKKFVCDQPGCDFAVTSYDEQWIMERQMAHDETKHPEIAAVVAAEPVAEEGE